MNYLLYRNSPINKFICSMEILKYWMFKSTCKRVIDHLVLASSNGDIKQLNYYWKEELKLTYKIVMESLL